MFLIDFTDHRVIGIIVGVSIAIISLVSIFIRFLVREYKKKKSVPTEEE